MMRKIGLFAVAIAILFPPLPALAENPRNSRHFSKSPIALGRVKKSPIPGYVHEQYAFLAADCSRSQIVDHYGAAVNPKDPKLLKSEHRRCIAFRDGRADS
jgi:hypothetical protein